MSLVYLNGRVLAHNEAQISPFDRGFLFGDGLYEVIPVFNRKPFRFDWHWQRLQTQLDFVKMTLPMSAADATTLSAQLIESEPHADQSLYWQITRGLSYPRQHTFEANAECTVFACTAPLKRPVADRLQQGYKAITALDTRWQHACIKSTSLLANILLHQQASDQEALDTILLRNGFAVEGSSSNLFIVKQDHLITPPLSDALVSGVTREVVLECAKQLQIPIHVQAIPEADLYQADEIWLTGSTKEIVPIVQLNAHRVGTQAGPVWSRLITAYRAMLPCS